MTTSVLDLFSVGIGPSSSHTVGPMRAALAFVEALERRAVLAETRRVTVTLYGSLGATAFGHGADKAILAGLMGQRPESVDADGLPALSDKVRAEGTLALPGAEPIPFDTASDLILKPRDRLPFHPNGMEYRAYDAAGETLYYDVSYSVGGGYVVRDGDNAAPEPEPDVPYPFQDAATLLDHAHTADLPISAIMHANEAAVHGADRVDRHLTQVWQAMQDCVAKGVASDGTMPGLNLKRRAARLYQALCARPEASLTDPLTIMDWVNLYALAVNEENAAGGRVVTAPTNGAAGIVPAVLHYYTRFCPGADAAGVNRFLLTAGAVGKLFKDNASIAGAEVGCQGEVGSACSMAAAGLTEVMGGTPRQVENAAEIGMEHNLGLTCDPVGGLVQVPCIERNAMGAIKAINAARLALKGDGDHFVSLDKVIRTMRDTGKDMRAKYKETARGGLAATIPIPSTVVDC
ncbi:L-serine ammonia-lyase [Yunchengibacter salinarum]|uniref:L-serine ammonia-lyase n=1 Tax=Yunchengibacter salinarum TaxID=3133399 RepID=UPI0035B5FD38